MSRSTALLFARWGTFALSLVSFTISFIALADLAHIAGQGPQAYLWPVMIDGAIVVGTVAVLAAPDWHSWSMLAGAALVSVVGNGIHAWVTQGTWIAVGVALTPPVFLLWVTHQTVRLGRETTEPVTPLTEGDGAPVIEIDPRARVLELLAEGGLSMREIARRVGTDDRNVRRWRDEAKTETPSLVGVST